jgi:hypothetical protein
VARLSAAVKRYPTMLRVLAALPAAAVLGLASAFSLPAGRADAWPPLPTAGTFLKTEIRTMAQGRYALAWTRLYPAHRAIVPKPVYVACEKRLPFPASFRSAKVVRVQRSMVSVAGSPKPVAGAAVTVRIALTWYGRDPLTFTHTFHLVPVGRRWTWILSPQRYRMYEASGCGFKPRV